MKTYVIVTNDALELPVSEEIIGADAVAQRLGIKLQRFRRCLCDGFPRKAKYKAVVVADRQFEDLAERNRERGKAYRMTHDRTEYFKQRYRRKKVQSA